jgi:trehalose 6-phosphate synthase
MIRTTRGLRVALLIASLAGLVTALMSWQSIQRERRSGLDDLGRRAGLLAHRVSPIVKEKRPFGTSLEGHSRLLGLAVYDDRGNLLGAGAGAGEYGDLLAPIAARARGSTADVVELVSSQESLLHVLVRPLPEAGAIITVVHDATYLDDRSNRSLLQASFWVVVVTLGLVVGTMLLTWVSYEGPLLRLARWMQGVRMGDGDDAKAPVLPIRLLSEESEHLAATLRAAKSSRLLQSSEAVRQDNVWTRERLSAHAASCLAGRPLVVVSNREPYMHVLKNGETQLIRPASGLVTALDPVLQACGGVWVAHGAGEADRAASDSKDRVTVPPGDPRYTLKRVWISREDEEGYYYGFSNEGLWPLCHLTYERPTFRISDWNRYVKVNHQFSDALLEELGGGGAMVWVHDYHLALLPQMLKAARPDLKVGLFWHIPWSPPEVFRVCPWAPQLVKGLLGADLVGFHLQQHCNNFLGTVDRLLEARLDWDQFSVDLEGHRTAVRPFPISVQDWSERGVEQGEALDARTRDLAERHRLGGLQVGVGVERIDYTKGLVERFHAIARLLEKHPEHRGKFSFVQLGAPSRTHLRRYRDLVSELESLAEAINWRFQENGWKPIHFLVAHHDPPAVHAFLRMAAFCVVSSLHDGMNLVAKEYVSARAGLDGTLVLSEFAGAARELPDALVINPYDGEGFADALHAALVMPADERRRRMTRMQRVVEENNVYRWAASFLSEAARHR